MTGIGVWCTMKNICFYQDKSDAQIARKLKLSRQYVNRMKKKLILRYISENK